MQFTVYENNSKSLILQFCKKIRYFCRFQNTVYYGRGRRPIKAAFLLFQEMALVSTLTISTVYLEDSGLYTCQSGFNSEANVTVIVISGT